MDVPAGALSTAQPPTGGGREAARAAAFGSGSPSLDITGALSQLLDPERGADTERMSYWAGMLAPTKSGGTAENMSNAMSAQLAAREARDKLKSAYIPLIMQSVAQQRANELQYAKFAQERREKSSPLINAGLYGLQAEGQPATMADAQQRIQDVGAQYGLQPDELAPHFDALTKASGPNGERLPQYLQQLRVAAAPAAEGIPKFGTNAAGQTVRQDALAGTLGMPGERGSSPINPTKGTVKVEEDTRGDVKEYTVGLQNKVSAYHDMLQRLNAIGANLDQFQPGRYAGMAGGFASLVKDISGRFPNASSKLVQDFANATLGADGKGGDPVAAAQFAEALKAQEAIVQTKAMVAGDGSRIGQQEVMMVAKNIPGNAMDPGAYKKFIEFMRSQAVNAMDKYQGWASHIEKADPARLSVHGFDVPYEARIAKGLQQGNYGVTDAPINPNDPPPRAATAPPAQTKAKTVDLKDYEPGAKVGPTGKVYIMGKEGPRLAKRIGG